MNRPIQENVGRICTINNPETGLQHDIHRIIAIARQEQDYAYVLESIETRFVPDVVETVVKVDDVTLLHN